MSPRQNVASHLAMVFTITFSILVAPVQCRPWETIGVEQLKGPEDLIYDPSEGVIYTGCKDGWIKRVKVDDSSVHKWVNTGGRPLGLAFAPNGDILAADAKKGLVRVTREGKVEVLTNEVGGVKFKLTDGVVVAEDGIIYFTDASYKYSLEKFALDILEGEPHGRLMSYDPSTNQTTLLVSKLYFPNGVAVSPDQQSVVYCETPKKRCRKYHINGSKNGTVEDFIEDLPGLPDNIHYDAQLQLYWIGMAGILDLMQDWGTAKRNPVMADILETDGGLVSVDLKGNEMTHYDDIKLALIASGIKISNSIYCGSLTYPFMLRLHL